MRRLARILLNALTVLSLFLCVVTVVCGCSSPANRYDVRFEADEQSVWRDGATWTTAAVSAQELDEIVRGFAAAQRLNFDFSGLRANIVVPRSREFLAQVWYVGDFGEPVLSVKVGFDRLVIEHRVTTAACGYDVRRNSN